MRQYFKKCPNNVFWGKKRKLYSIRKKNLNLTDPVLKVSQWLLQTPNYHMAWPEILLFSFFSLSLPEIYDGGLFPVSPVNLINNVVNAKSTPKLFVCLYFP